MIVKGAASTPPSARAGALDGAVFARAGRPIFFARQLAVRPAAGGEVALGGGPAELLARDCLLRRYLPPDWRHKHPLEQDDKGGPAAGPKGDIKGWRGGEPYCAWAGRVPESAALRMARLLSGALLPIWGFRLAAQGFPFLAVPALLVLLGVRLLLSAVFDSDVSFTVSPALLCRGDSCRELEQASTARLDWVFLPSRLSWLPALRLRLSGEDWLIPLSLRGWHNFWDCLRALRPDLQLPDWRDKPEVVKGLTSWRGAVWLPPGAKIAGPGPGLRAVVAAIALLLSSAAVRLPAVAMPYWLQLLLVSASAPAALEWLERCWPTRILEFPKNTHG